MTLPLPNCDDPIESPLWIKPLTGVDPHEGGDVVLAPALETRFLEWFEL